MELSVVLIAKNEQDNIARLIESVLRATIDLSSKEIVLVDSNSSDRTVEIASRYPVRIVRLLPHESIRLCAAAGRFVGTHYTTGEYVLFLDGDHELFDGWLERARAIMEAHAEVGVVGGFRIDLPKGAPTGGRDIAPVGVDGQFKDTVHAGPGAIYRRSVLDRVGTFLPFLISDEEPELCLRIRSAGFRVVRTDYPVVFHRDDLRNTFSSMFARRRKNLYLGFGQNLRYHARSGLLTRYIRDRGFALPLVAALLVGIASLLLSFWAGNLVPFAFLVGVAVLVLAAYAARKRSLHATAHSLLNRVFMLEGIKGVALAPLDSDDYLQHVEVVQ